MLGGISRIAQKQEAGKGALRAAFERVIAWVTGGSTTTRNGRADGARNDSLW